MTKQTDIIARRAGAALLTVVLLGLTLLSGPQPALAQTTGSTTARSVGESRQGDSGGLFTVRRSLGVVFLAGSVVLVSQGFDLKDEADEFYDAYEAATDPAEIEKFYQRTTNRDVRSQVSWALAAAFGITGLRLALTGNGSSAPAGPVTLGSVADGAATYSSLSLVPAITPRAVGLRLQRHFY